MRPNSTALSTAVTVAAIVITFQSAPASAQPATAPQNPSTCPGAPASPGSPGSPGQAAVPLTGGTAGTTGTTGTTGVSPDPAAPTPTAQTTDAVPQSPPTQANLPADPAAVTVLTTTPGGGLKAREVPAADPAATAAVLNRKPHTIASPVVGRAILTDPTAAGPTTAAPTAAGPTTTADPTASTPCATTSTTRTDTIPRPGAAATRTDTVPRPDGAARDMQWALNRVQAEDAWKSSTGAGVIVAVIDTGVDANHPDLAGSLVPGFDVLRNRSSSALTDGHGHGTHVAGAIAGHGAVTGIAPDAKIMPIRAMNSQGFGTTANVVAGLIWAVNHGADVINMSLGSTTPDTAERAAIKWARGRGVLVVAAAGNDAGISIVYPAAYGDKKANAPVESDPVIGVGAVDRHGTLGYFSQIGPSVDVTAPGVRVLSTFPVAQGSYAWESGTSMAAPYVAGIVALALSYQRANSPTRTAPEMALAADRALRSSARDLGAPGVDRSYGSGDASAAGTLAALGADAWLAMPADVGLSGSSDGNATASFATPPGTEVRAVLSEGGGSEGARGETDPDGGTTLWSGPGGGAIQLPITGLTPSRAYTLTIFVTDGTHRSRAVTGLRPVTWSLKTPKTLMANTRANIAVATVLPSLGSGVPAGRITVTYRWKGHSKTVRVSPLDSAQIRLPLPRSSTNMTIRASIDGGYGNWPSVSRAYVVRIHR